MSAWVEVSGFRFQSFGVWVSGFGFGFQVAAAPSARGEGYYCNTASIRNSGYGSIPHLFRVKRFRVQYLNKKKIELKNFWQWSSLHEFLNITSKEHAVL